MEKTLQYYMNKETGELLTYAEMVVQAAEWYDIPDETNMFSFEDRYSAPKYCGYIPSKKESVFESLKNAVSEKDSEIEKALVDFTLEMCYIKGIKRMKDVKMVIEYSYIEYKEMKYREGLISNCQERIAEAKAKLDSMQSGTYKEIKPLFDLIDNLEEQIGILYTDLWDYRKRCIEAHIRKVQE